MEYINWSIKRLLRLQSYKTVFDLETEEPNQNHAVGLFKLEQNRKKNIFTIYRVFN